MELLQQGWDLNVGSYAKPPVFSGKRTWVNKNTQARLRAACGHRCSSVESCLKCGCSGTEVPGWLLLSCCSRCAMLLRSCFVHWHCCVKVSYSWGISCDSLVLYSSLWTSPWSCCIKREIWMSDLAQPYVFSGAWTETNQLVCVTGAGIVALASNPTEVPRELFLSCCWRCDMLLCKCHWRCLALLHQGYLFLRYVLRFRGVLQSWSCNFRCHGVYFLGTCEVDSWSLQIAVEWLQPCS